MSKYLFAMVLVLASPMAGCWNLTLGDSETHGVVLNSETKQPISGAYVIAYWRGVKTGIVDARSTCYHVETTVSDGQGRFVVPGWRNWNLTSQERYITDKRQELHAYKKGYTFFRQKNEDGTVVEQSNGAMLLKPFTGIPADRLSVLDTGPDCGREDGSIKNVLPYYRAMLDEGRELAAQTGDDRFEEALLIAVEVMELGADVARVNAGRRLNAREAKGKGNAK